MVLHGRYFMGIFHVECSEIITNNVIFSRVLEKRKNHPPSDGNFHRENAVLRSIGFGGSPRLFWKKPSKATGFYQLAYHPIKLQTYCTIWLFNSSPWKLTICSR